MLIRLGFALPGGDTPPTEFRLFRKGDNSTEKGTFVFDDKAAKLVMARYGKRGTRCFMDYNHSSLDKTPKDPKESAKAAGWFDLEVRGGELWATNITWTPPATEAFANKEFAYFSPAFSTDNGNRIVDLINCALTNLPATHDIPQLVAASSIDVVECSGCGALMTLARSMTMQTIIFDKEAFSKAEAVQWCKDHDYEAEIDETEDSYRMRQRDPGDFDTKTFRTIDITNGVQAVVGKLKDQQASRDASIAPSGGHPEMLNAPEGAEGEDMDPEKYKKMEEELEETKKAKRTLEEELRKVKKLEADAEEAKKAKKAKKLAEGGDGSEEEDLEETKKASRIVAAARLVTGKDEPDAVVGALHALSTQGDQLKALVAWKAESDARELAKRVDEAVVTGKLLPSKRASMIAAGAKALDTYLEMVGDVRVGPPTGEHQPDPGHTPPSTQPNAPVELTREQRELMAYFGNTEEETVTMAREIQSGKLGRGARMTMPTPSGNSGQAS